MLLLGRLIFPSLQQPLKPLVSCILLFGRLFAVQNLYTHYIQRSTSDDGALIKSESSALAASSL